MELDGKVIKEGTVANVPPTAPGSSCVVDVEFQLDPEQVRALGSAVCMHAYVHVYLNAHMTCVELGSSHTLDILMTSGDCDCCEFETAAAASCRGGACWRAHTWHLCVHTQYMDTCTQT
jgi:hypothetical protein